MATKISKADKDIALAEIKAVISEETALGSRYFEATFKLKVRAGKAMWNLFLTVNGDDNVKPQDVKFADITTALGIDKDHKFLGLRPLSVVSEDYIAFRANAVTGNAFTVASVETNKANPGKVANSFRAIAPALRDIVNAANNVTTTSNRAPKQETIDAANLLANNKTVAWNYGYQGAFTGADENDIAIVWTTADKNLVRGLVNRSGIDMAQLRSIDKKDVELVRALLNGVLDDVKRNGSTADVDKDTEPTDIEGKVKNSRSKK